MARVAASKRLALSSCGAARGDGESPPTQKSSKTNLTLELDAGAILPEAESQPLTGPSATWTCDTMLPSAVRS